MFPFDTIDMHSTDQIKNNNSNSMQTKQIGDSLTLFGGSQNDNFNISPPFLTDTTTIQMTLEQILNDANW